MESSRGSWTARSRTAAAWTFAVVAILYLAVGVTWFWLNLSQQPPYGDSAKYRYFTETVTVDRLHGGLFPLLLGIANPWTGSLERFQLFQSGVLALCLAYFVYALRGADFARSAYGRRGVAGAFASLLLLLLVDPLLGHFALSLMQDSFALSGCLAFGAALAELTRDGTRRWVAAAVLLVGFALAAGVRVEKSWVLLATLVATLPCWFLIARGFPSAQPAGLRARGGVALAVVLLGFAAVQSLQASMYREPPQSPTFAHNHWSLRTTILHHRIVFPNLASVYEQLAPESRAMLTRRDAELYDQRIHNTWRVIDTATHRERESRQRLTQDLASTAFRHRWAAIALDVASDTAENLLAPLSFYTRLARWSAGGASPRAWTKRFEAAPWTYHTLAHHQPRLSALYVALAGTLFVFACCLALLHVRESLRGKCWKPTRETALSLAPVVLLCIANAFAFSLSADLVHPRYTLFAHTAGMLLVYRGALAWLFAARVAG